MCCLPYHSQSKNGGLSLYGWPIGSSFTRSSSHAAHPNNLSISSSVGKEPEPTTTHATSISANANRVPVLSWLQPIFDGTELDCVLDVVVAMPSDEKSSGVPPFSIICIESFAPSQAQYPKTQSPNLGVEDLRNATSPEASSGRTKIYDLLYSPALACDT